MFMVSSTMASLTLDPFQGHNVKDQHIKATSFS